MNYFEQRPWGNFENLLEEDYCKVKKITIFPNQSPSYQYHYRRSETWIIINGYGELKLDDTLIKIKPKDVIEIPKLSKHQIMNTSSENLVFIEIQTGEYFGEDDIVRLDDKYGRI
jgi:mannose-6-phosphate isomerase-like protein (cupin superfamily)